MAQYSLNLPEAEVDEIILNKYGDKVKVLSNDATFFKKFTDGYQKIIEISDGIPREMDEIGDIDEENDDAAAISKKVDGMATVNSKFSEQACEVIDGIFGEGTAKLSFRDWYEAKQDFAPDLSLIMAFFATMIPIMEQIFDKKVEQAQNISLQRMEKYKPRDHKGPQK